MDVNIEVAWKDELWKQYVDRSAQEQLYMLAQTSKEGRQLAYSIMSKLFFIVALYVVLHQIIQIKSIPIQLQQINLEISAKLVRKATFGEKRILKVSLPL